MTDDQQGGTTPAPEALASSDTPTSQQTAAAIAVADEPATPAEPETTAEAPEAAAPEPATATAAPDADTAAAEPDAPEAPTASSDAGAPEAAIAAPQAPEPAGDAVEAAIAPAEVADASSAAPEAAIAPPDTAEATDTAEAPDAAEAPSPAAGAVTIDEDLADAPPAAEEEDEEPAPVPSRRTGPEPTTMEELLAEQDSDIKSFKHGDVVEGTIVRIDKDEILVDIGAKSEGVVSNRELYGRHAESQPQLSIGDVVLVYVLQPESPEGHVVLSLRRAGLERKWRSMQELFEAGTIIDAPVIDHNKGGLIVDCGIRGFVPISQIVDFPRRPQNEQPRDAAQEIAEKLQPYIGRKLRLKILEVNRKANRLILSEKVALYEERREKRDELFSSLQVGQKVTGNVRSIAPFGIFIDLGGIDGLVHKSELSWNKVNNPEAGYKVGDEVEAEVIDINHERGRISLSIRRLQPDPWESTVADFKVGDVIDGTVTKLVNFGAFVRVREGLEGLIHISELSHQRVAHPGDVVHEGQVLKLKIISLDSERHRLGLSLKQAEEPPARPVAEAGTPSAMPTPGEPRQRRERRERPERGYAPSETHSEPEGGIDTTLASAFAQVRSQLAAAEAEDDVPAGGTAPAAASAGTDAVAQPVDADEADTAEAEAGTAEPEAVAAEPQAAADEPAAVAEPETVAIPIDAEEPAAIGVVETPAPDAAPEPAAQPEVDAAPEPDAVAETAPEPEAPTAPEPEPAAEAIPALEPATDDAPRSQVAETAAEGALTVGDEAFDDTANGPGDAPAAAAEDGAQDDKA